MDLAVYLKVLRRRWELVAVGVLVALVLGLFSAARVDFDGLIPGLEHRQDEVWVSASTLFVTEEGFPWGRANVDVTGAVDTTRYSGLAQLYTALAQSDAVRRSVMRRAPEGAKYEADVVRSADQSVLPLIYMKGFGPSPEAAETIANSAARSFRSYLARQQAQNEIPLKRRVQVVQITDATEAEIFAPRSMVRPVFVFLLVLMVFVALAFVAENAGFRMPWPPVRSRRPDPIPTGAPPRAAEQVATTIAQAGEARASSRPAPPAESWKLGEPRRPAEEPPARVQRWAEPVPVSEEPPAEEPPARVQRWA